MLSDGQGLAASTSQRRGYGGHAASLREEIKQLLLEQKLRPGDPIPSETSLIEQLQVSRGSLREALKSLQAQGILETRHGSGTFVSELSFEGLADGLVFHSRLAGDDAIRTASELADVRQILETELVKRVTTAGLSQSRVDALRQIVAAMTTRADSNEVLDDLDREFHAELYSDLNMRMVGQLLEAFWKALASAKPLLPPGSTIDGEAVERHRAIVDAVASRDPARAEAAMREHFANTQSWINRGRVD